MLTLQVNIHLLFGVSEWYQGHNIVFSLNKKEKKTLLQLLAWKLWQSSLKFDKPQ